MVSTHKQKFPSEKSTFQGYSVYNNNNNNDILLRTHGPYHRHKKICRLCMFRCVDTICCESDYKWTSGS